MCLQEACVTAADWTIEVSGLKRANLCTAGDVGREIAHLVQDEWRKRNHKGGNWAEASAAPAI